MSRSSTTVPVRRGPGRPREFNMDAALDRALLLFRERGYHAASLSELGAAMQLASGSIYKAFADKRAIFLAAFGRYVDLRGSDLRTLVDAKPNGLEKLQATLRFYAEASHGLEGQRGCLVVGSVVALATFDPEMARRITATLVNLEKFLRNLIRLGQRDGSVPAGCDVNSAARTMLCLVQGLRVVGKSGRSRAEMMAVVDQALKLAG